MSLHAAPPPSKIGDALLDAGQAVQRPAAPVAPVAPRPGFPVKLSVSDPNALPPPAAPTAPSTLRSLPLGAEKSLAPMPLSPRAVSPADKQRLLELLSATQAARAPSAAIRSATPPVPPAASTARPSILGELSKAAKPAATPQKAGATAAKPAASSSKPVAASKPAAGEKKAGIKERLSQTGADLKTKARKKKEHWVQKVRAAKQQASKTWKEAPGKAKAKAKNFGDSAKKKLDPRTYIKPSEPPPNIEGATGSASKVKPEGL